MSFSRTYQIAKNEFGFYALHVPWLGKPPHAHKSWKDPDIVEKISTTDFVLVTNNRRDFVGKYYRDGGLNVHNGLIVILQKSDLESEIRLFRLVMKFIMSMESTLNKLIEIDASGHIRAAEWPNHDLATPWADPFK